MYLYKSSVECLKFADAQSCLINLARDNNCSLKLQTTSLNFFKERVSFELRGDKENVDNLVLQLNQDIVNYNLPTHLKDKNYKVKRINVTKENETFTIEVKSKKEKLVKELAMELMENLSVYLQVKEVHNGFFRPKTITITLNGNKEHMDVFGNLLLHYLKKDM